MSNERAAPVKPVQVGLVEMLQPTYQAVARFIRSIEGISGETIDSVPRFKPMPERLDVGMMGAVGLGLVAPVATTALGVTVEPGSTGWVVNPEVKETDESPAATLESAPTVAYWAVARSVDTGAKEVVVSSMGLTGDSTVSTDDVSAPLGTPVAVSLPVIVVTVDAVPAVSAPPLLPPPQAARAELRPTT